MLTDGRFSGATRGASIGHVSPEAAAGGTIAIVQDGDIINIDIPNGKLELAVSDDEIARRKAALKPFKSNVTGYLKKICSPCIFCSTRCYRNFRRLIGEVLLLLQE